MFTADKGLNLIGDNFGLSEEEPNHSDCIYENDSLFRIVVFLVMTPCSLVEWYQHFGCHTANFICRAEIQTLVPTYGVEVIVTYKTTTRISIAFNTSNPNTINVIPH
jgi:hypothetical protein